MQNCPSCHREWPEDRFNDKTPYCFRCRASSLQFNYGNRGRQQFHDVTVKEHNDQIKRESKANGIEAVPYHTATTAVPTPRLMNDLKKTLSNGQKAE